MHIATILNPIKELFNLIDRSSFLSNFISGLLILLIGGLFGRLFLPRYLASLRKPQKLELLFSETNDNSLKLEQRPNNFFGFNASFRFSNSSNTTFGHIYWHTWIPENLNPEALSSESSSSGRTPTQRSEQYIGQQYTHFSGQFLEPVFARQNRAFHYQFSGLFKDSGVSEAITIYYKIATEFGVYPDKLKEDVKSGKILDIGTCGKLYLKIPS